MHAVGTAHSIAHVLGKKDVLKQYHAALMKGTPSSGDHGASVPGDAPGISEMRKMIGSIVQQRANG